MPTSEHPADCYCGQAIEAPAHTTTRGAHCPRCGRMTTRRPRPMARKRVFV
jgi:uncharacterized paraquat-inducible protein A